MLAGGVAPRNSGSKAQHNPLTIDGMVESAEETPNQPARDAVQPSRPAGRHSFLDQVNCGKFKLPGRGLPYPSPSPERVAVPNGAQFLTSTFSGQTGSRPYKLYIPSGYRGHAVALVVMLHGCTQSPDDFAVGTRMNEASRGTRPAWWSTLVRPIRRTRRSAGTGSERATSSVTKASRLLRELHARSFACYAIDPQRIYVAGLSAGGAAAAVMGHAYPDLYAAVGVHSGLACGAARDMPSAFAAMQRGQRRFWQTAQPCNLEASRRVVPTIVFHGDGDTTVNPCNADAVVMQSARLAALRTQAEEGRVPHGHIIGVRCMSMRTRRR